MGSLRGKSETKKWITFLHFPVVDRDSALNLCVLAHELGHFVDEVLHIYQRLLPMELDKDSFEKLVNTRCSTPAFGLKSKPGDPQLTFETIFTKAGVRARCYLSCNEMLERWIREIIADVLAVHAIGPAAFFSFSDFLGYVGAENVTSSSHPAPAFRLNLMLDELQKTMGYSSSSAIDTLLQGCLSRVSSDAGSVTYKDEWDVVYKTIQANLAKAGPDNLLGKIRPFVAAYSFDSAKYREQVPHILSRLRRGIAPIETTGRDGAREASSVVAILNAGWELYKTDMQSFYGEFRTEVSKMECLANLNHLLFKAIEASEVVRRWK